MEPMNCTASVKADSVEVWVPTQNIEGSLAAAAEAAGVTPDKVTANLTLLGGGFGRRGRQDYVTQAVHIAKAVGTPVKLIWSREEDIQHGSYRPISMGKLQAGLDEKRDPHPGRPVARRQHQPERRLPGMLHGRGGEGGRQGPAGVPPGADGQPPEASGRAERRGRAGVGEPTICVAAPSVLNAIHAAIGRPVRSLPLKNVDLRSA
jgi:CO/xanthine dehydrogenase Mo-binding subunit